MSFHKHFLGSTAKIKLVIYLIGMGFILKQKRGVCLVIFDDKQGPGCLIMKV